MRFLKSWLKNQAPPESMPQLVVRQARMMMAAKRPLPAVLKKMLTALASSWPPFGEWPSTIVLVAPRYASEP